jgi:hypothetical protein
MAVKPSDVCEPEPPEPVFASRKRRREGAEPLRTLARQRRRGRGRMAFGILLNRAAGPGQETAALIAAGMPLTYSVITAGTAQAE